MLKYINGKAELKLLTFFIQKTFMAINSIFNIQEWFLPSLASQAHVKSVSRKLTFSQESRCHVTSNRWDFVWEIEYWGLQTLNIIIFLTLIFFYKINKGDLPLMYSCVLWCEFIDLVVFLGCYCLTPIIVTLFIIRRIMTYYDRGQTITAQKNRPLSIVTLHRLSCEKVNLHNTLVTWTWEACAPYYTWWYLQN